MPVKKKAPARKKATGRKVNGLAKYRTFIKKATAVADRQVKAAEKKLTEAKKKKAAATKAAAKKWKKSN